MGTGNICQIKLHGNGLLHHELWVFGSCNKIKANFCVLGQDQLHLINIYHYQTLCISYDINCLLSWHCLVFCQQHNIFFNSVMEIKNIVGQINLYSQFFLKQSWMLDLSIFIINILPYSTLLFLHLPKNERIKMKTYLNISEHVWNINLK